MISTTAYELLAFSSLACDEPAVSDTIFKTNLKSHKVSQGLFKISLDNNSNNTDNTVTIHDWSSVHHHNEF